MLVRYLQPFENHFITRRFPFLVLMAALFFSCKRDSQKIESPDGYNFSSGYRYTLPSVLNEISGLAYYAKDSSVFAINDEKGFLFKFTGEQNDKGMIYQLVELIPIDPKKKNIFKVKLTINKNDKFIVSAKLFDKNGGVETIAVDKLTPDACSNDSLYSFSAGNYPGAEIVDLR